MCVSTQDMQWNRLAFLVRDNLASMSFQRRLLDAVSRLGMTDGAVADRLNADGYDASHDKIARWRKGKSLPGVDDLPVVAKALESDLVWLATGRRDASTLDDDEATILVVAKSLRLPLDEAIRRLSAAGASPSMPEDPPSGAGSASPHRVLRSRNRTTELRNKLADNATKEGES